MNKTKDEQILDIVLIICIIIGSLFILYGFICNIGYCILGAPLVLLGLGMYANTNDNTGAIKITCPKCGAPMVKRQGKYGYFYGCTNYPYCHGSRDYN